jgi:hypothetical protein
MGVARDVGHVEAISQRLYYGCRPPWCCVCVCVCKCECECECVCVCVCVWNVSGTDADPLVDVGVERSGLGLGSRPM